MIHKQLKDDRFTVIFNALSQRVFRYVYSHMRDKQIATDIVQNAFLKLYERIESINEGGETPYIITIAKNLLIDHYRTRKEHVEFDDEVLPSCNPIYYEAESPLAESLVREDGEFVSRLIDSLPEPDSDIVRLRAIVGWSYCEIAEKYSLSEDATRKRYSRSLKEMHDTVIRSYPRYVNK
jgi:RNA polymerase sigma-70 factor (ECF subfamily)